MLHSCAYVSVVQVLNNAIHYEPCFPSVLHYVSKRIRCSHGGNYLFYLVMVTYFSIDILSLVFLKGEIWEMLYLNIFYIIGCNNYVLYNIFLLRGDVEIMTPSRSCKLCLREDVRVSLQTQL